MYWRIRIYYVPLCSEKSDGFLTNKSFIVDKVIVTEAGKKFSLYHSTLKAIKVKYDNKDVIVEAEQNFDIAKKWIEKFFSLDCP